jgi:hypothetical protein
MYIYIFVKAAAAESGCRHYTSHAAILRVEAAAVESGDIRRVFQE